MGAYGHRFVNTPNFDRVARDGVLFANAFTPNPKCAPSRACILTGRQTWQLERACNHFGVFPAKFPVYPSILESAGYHVGYTGKGWAPGDWKAGGFTRNPAGPEYNERFLEPPAETHISSRDYAANFRDFLDARQAGAPFCFWYGGHEPHRPYTVDEGLRAGKDPRSVAVPPYFPDDDVVRRDMLDYANEIDWFDRQLGFMLEELERRGELANTLVVVTSDNGMPFPRVKGQMYEDDFHLPMAMCWPARVPGARTVDDLVSFIDLAPTFLEAAGVTSPEPMTGRSFLDVLTARESGHVDPTRTQVFLGRERHDLGREGDVGYPVRCIRSERYLYVWNLKPERWPAGNPETGFTNTDSSPTKSLILAQHENAEDTYFSLAFGKRPEEELYDITADRACMENLADAPEHRAVKERLRTNLEEYLRETKDPRIAGGGDAFDTYEYVGTAPHSWKAYVQGAWQRQRY